MIWIKGLLRLMFFGILLGLLACFITDNQQAVELSLFPLPFIIELPLYALGLIMLVIGLLAGSMMVYVGSAMAHWRLKRKEQHAQKKIMLMEQEIHALRLEKQAQAYYAPTPHTSALITLP